MYSILFLVGASFLICLLLTPLVRTWSLRHGFVDAPNKRKVHVAPTPRTGGVAIGLAYVGAVVLLFSLPLDAATIVDLPLTFHLLPALLTLFGVGLIDDLVGLTARQKLFGQLAASCLAYFGGVQVLGVSGLTVPGWLAFPLTLFWLVACSNAFNLIDGIDGLATGVGVFATFTTLAAAIFQGNVALALATAPLVGALLAFLRYNFNPASIFLGDCGSLTIGFLLGCFAALWSQKSATLFGLTAPMMALSLPLLETSISIVRRFLRGQPIFDPDRNHAHHRLLDRGLSTRRVALLLYGACGVAAAFSLLVSMSNGRFNGLLLIGFCVAAWIGVQLVGYVEFETARHLMLTGTLRHVVKARLFVDAFEKKAAMARTPGDHWEIVQELIAEFEFTHVRMSLAGTIYEIESSNHDPAHCCSIRIPLSNSGYVNFSYPVGASVRHAVAITFIVAILQRYLHANALRLPPSITVAPATVHPHSAAEALTPDVTAAVFSERHAS